MEGRLGVVQALNSMTDDAVRFGQFRFDLRRRELSLAVIVGWVAWTAPYTDRHRTCHSHIDPFELMKKSNGLVHQQYDAF